MELYKTVFIIIYCFAAFGWFVYGIRAYKEWKDTGEPVSYYSPL